MTHNPDPEKDLLLSLLTYLDKQDRKSILVGLAGAIMDYYRMNNYANLTDEEKVLFIIRIKANSKFVENFMENRPNGDLEIKNIGNMK